MALIGLGLEPARFRIDAVDLSPLQLEAARKAVYAVNAFRSDDLRFRDRHFRYQPDGFRLDPAIVSTVNFHRGNLIDSEFLGGSESYDVIFCRNLLIYLDEPARRSAVLNIDRLLAPAGVLFVGHAERLSLLSPKFRAVGESGCFAFARRTESRDAAQRGARPREKTVSRHNHKPDESNVAPAMSASKPRAPVGQNSLTRVSEPPDLLSEAKRLAGEGKHEEAKNLCEREVRSHATSAAGYFLLGMIHQAAGDRAAAETALARAVYLEPRHEEALLALALLADRRGDETAAANYRRRAQRALEEQPL
jgi:chemotaxis protein methyltransferase WspC